MSNKKYRPTIDIFETQPKWFTENVEMYVQRCLFIYFAALEEHIEHMTVFELKRNLAEAKSDPHSDYLAFEMDCNVPIITEAFIEMIGEELAARQSIAAELNRQKRLATK